MNIDLDSALKILVANDLSGGNNVLTRFNNYIITSYYKGWLE